MKNKQVLGIDIGGTHIKSALISPKGEIFSPEIHSTGSWVAEGFMKSLKKYIHLFDKLELVGCGIAIPGMLSRDGNQALYVPSIPSLDLVYIKDEIQEEFPEMRFVLENDANAAAYGEFSQQGASVGNSLMLITMGTGIGCGMVLNGHIFKGGNGNALELGETLSRGNVILEKLIGAHGIENLASERIQEFKGSTGISKCEILTVRQIVEQANANDEFAIQILTEAGQILGEALVNVIWLFDVSHISIGGGIAEGFIAIEQGIWSVLHKYLPAQMTQQIKLSKAFTGNNAGMLGVAMLCFRNNNQ